MKNSKEYAEKIAKLFRSYKQQIDESETPAYDEPLEALVYGLFSEHATEAQSGRIYKKIQQHFVDLNDLRVSRPEEIAEITQNFTDTGRQTALALGRLLNRVYDQFDCMSLKALTETGKRQGRKELEELGDVPRFVVDYVFVTALGGHAIPLTEPMTEYLLREELIAPESTEDEIHGFLDRQVSASDGWLFYRLLRSLSEGTLSTSPSKNSKSPASPKKTTKKKTVQTSSKTRTKTKKVTKRTKKK